MNPSVYVETSIPSYLAAETSPNLVTAGHQVITRQWWTTRRQFFLPYTSDVVLEEARRGDPEMARRRLSYLEGLPLLGLGDAVHGLARALLVKKVLPDTAAVDALHIALSAVSGMEFLITWNCRHIANASIRPRVEALCRANGYEPPTICTPEELME